MNEQRSTLRLHVSESPVAADLLPGDLRAYADQRQQVREQQLRAEGFQSATQTSVLALEKAADLVADCRQELEGSAVSLAIEIAQELLRVELANGNYEITQIVREVLASHTGATGTTILHVNPEDAEALSEVRFRSGTEIQADPSIRRGDVHLETDQGVLVREMDECMNAIRNKLLEATN